MANKTVNINRGFVVYHNESGCFRQGSNHRVTESVKVAK